jgi:dihydrofolate reductase
MSTARAESVVYIATSLDGFIARSDGGIDWLPTPPEGEDFGWAAFIADIDAIVMGRKTFETVLSFGIWPYEGTPLFVLSSTLSAVPEHLAGKAECLCLEPTALMAHLAERGYRRIYVDGGQTIQGLLREGLLDELIVTTIPVLIGSGIPLFGALPADIVWRHLGTETLTGGLVRSRYRRTETQGPA